MGNRSSSIQPSGPPPLLSAAVLGNLQAFGESWNDETSIGITDSQDNNVLHALFSCRGSGMTNCPEILDRIHDSLSTQKWMDAYRAQNAIGCTPLWILVAYGNVDLFKMVRNKFIQEDQAKAFLEILKQPNHQGDSPLLATCSQGKIDMVKYWKEELPDEFTTAMRGSNRKGTTPLQIIVGNNHPDLLKFVLEEETDQSQLVKFNRAGLSLFHICSERNAEEILQILLNYANNDLEKILSLQDKNGANPLHVAAFCGNEQAAKVWIDAVVLRTVVLECEESKKVKLLDMLDGQGRTAYWLGMVKGHETIGEMLADQGVDTRNPKMVQEIEEAEERRRTAAAARQRQPAIDGSALL